MNTPIQRLDFPNERGIRLYCKRDDLLPFSLGGNKVRIGKVFYQDMLEKKKDCMIVYGNSRSNLCRVLANLCSAGQIPCYMICSGDGEEGSIQTNNSRLMKWLGAEVIPCTANTIAQTVEDTMEMLTAKGYHPYYIFGNKFGTGNEGTPVQAYVDGYREIRAWEEEHQTMFSHIFFASGTGSTQCGLVSGKMLEKGQEEVVGISISSREYDRAMQIMKTGITDYFSKNSLKLPEDFEKELHLEMAYRQLGYGKYDDRIMDVIKEEFCRNGLPLDPTYTGKAFWGMKEYIREKKLEDCDILFLHTGGTPLFYDCLPGGTL